MCIVCNQKEALRVVEQGLEAMANSLGEMIELVRRYCPCAVASEREALERAQALLQGDPDTLTQPDMFERSQQAPQGIPDDVWQAMPPEVRALMLAAQELGGIVQVVKLSDILGEPETKH